MSTFARFWLRWGGDTTEHSQNRFCSETPCFAVSKFGQKKGPKDRSKGPNLFLPFLLSLLNRD